MILNNDQPLTLTHCQDDISPMPVLKKARYEIFAQEMARGTSASDSYIKAGFSANRANALRLKTNESIMARIAELQERTAKMAEVSVERIAQELARIGFSNITDAIQIKGGKVKISDTSGLSPDVTAAIAGIRQTKDGIEVKFHDKQAALVTLGRHIGMFKENINLNVTVSLVDLVLASYPAAPEPKTIEHSPSQNND